MDANAIIIEKKKQRQAALAARDLMPLHLRAAKSRAIVDNLLGLSAAASCDIWFVYATFRSEVETGTLIMRLLAAGKTVAVPRIDTVARTMSAIVIEDAVRDVVSGPWGIPEPAPNLSRAIDCGAIDVVVVPGAAFTRDGRRIGYGGGYYDRFMKDCLAPSAGLAYDQQVLPELAQDGSHDMVLDYIVTESGAIRCCDFL